LLVTRDGSAARIVLNRPGKRHALSLELMEEMTGALRAASALPDTRAIVIEGAGPSFRSGTTYRT
jgi:enoyl-CoA hydratase/carnithine racemase